MTTKKAQNEAKVQSVATSPPTSSAAAEPSGNGEAKPNRQTLATMARWAGEQASEMDLSGLFHSLPLNKAFSVYERMRSNLATAGRILDERSNQPEQQYCKTCGISFQDYIKTSRRNDWMLNRPHYKDGDPRITVVDHFCSMACVSLENNKTQGVYGMSDRGMLPQDNPKNHPRQFPEKTS